MHETFTHRGQTYRLSDINDKTHRYESGQDLVCKAAHILEMIEGYERAIAKKPQLRSQLQTGIRSLRMSLDSFVSGVKPITEEA